MRRRTTMSDEVDFCAQLIHRAFQSNWNALPDDQKKESWGKRANTAYYDLSEHGKEMYRACARAVLAVYCPAAVAILRDSDDDDDLGF
jgi:hypothetical protein